MRLFDLANEAQRSAARVAPIDPFSHSILKASFVMSLQQLMHSSEICLKGLE
jgi:hypothetical protein